MATETKNYKFRKPDETDFYDINLYNEFLDRVDGELFDRGNIKSLWRGALLQGGKVEFTIPMECFHNRNTTLTLLVEGYFSQLVDGIATGTNIGLLAFTFCFGLDDMFGEIYPAGRPVYGPVMDEDNNIVAELYKTYYANGESAALNVLIRVKKVTDTRYAVCTVEIYTGRGGDETITCVSALIPQDLED